MNGKRARQIRGLAWDACVEAATRTGDRRWITGTNLKIVGRKIKRSYVRTGEFPATVERPRGSARAVRPTAGAIYRRYLGDAS